MKPEEIQSITKLKEIVSYEITSKYFMMYINNKEVIHFDFLDTEKPERRILILKDKSFAQHLIQYFGNKIDNLEEKFLHDMRDSEIKKDLEKAINQYFI